MKGRCSLMGVVNLAKNSLIDPLVRKAQMINWYSTLEVLFKMTEYTKNREVSFLMSKAETSNKFFMNTRYLCVHCVRDFNYLLQMGLKVLTEPRLYNLYYSVLEFKDKFPFWKLGVERKVKVKNWVEKKMLNYIRGYDLFFDIDADKNTFESAKLTVTRLMEVLNNYGVVYEIRNSGKGFHIICPNQQFQDLDLNYNEDYEDKKNVANIFYNIARNLNQEVSCLIDVAVYDLRRVTKIPYSLVLYSDETRVCFPFNSLSEFERFKYSDGTLDGFRKFITDGEVGSWQTLLRNRETFIFNKDVKKTYIREFIEDYGEFKTI